MPTWEEQRNRHAVTRPAAIAHAANGQLAGGVLVAIEDGHGDPIGELEATAARAWMAMVAAARADGIYLTDSGDEDAYRTLDGQQRMFGQRYTTTDQGHGHRVCNGQTWFLRRGVATAACPGTSKHGLGLAVDVAGATPGGRRLGWLERNAARFGWEWEVVGEPWHLHYWPGDNIPQAVLDHEGDDDMTDADIEKLATRIADKVAPAINQAADNMVGGLAKHLDALPAAIAHALGK
jgi:hypothetical protein